MTQLFVTALMNNKFIGIFKVENFKIQKTKKRFQVNLESFREKTFFQEAGAQLAGRISKITNWEVYEKDKKGAPTCGFKVSTLPYQIIMQYYAFTMQYEFKRGYI